MKWHGKTVKSITLAGNSTETNELSKILTSICESSVENQGNNTERCLDHFNNDDNTKTSMDATSGKRLNTAGLLCNDQESLENSFNKSDNTIADETNLGDGIACEQALWVKESLQGSL